MIKINVANMLSFHGFTEAAKTIFMNIIDGCGTNDELRANIKIGVDRINALPFDPDAPTVREDASSYAECVLNMLDNGRLSL